MTVVSSAASRDLVAAVEDVDELIAVLGPHDGVAPGRREVGVPEPGLNNMNGHAVLKRTGGPVGTQRVRVAESLGHPGLGGGAVDDLVDRLGGEPSGLLGAAVASEAHEDELVIPEPATARERVNRQPRRQRGVSRGGHVDLALHAALTPHKQPEMASV